MSEPDDGVVSAVAGDPIALGKDSEWVRGLGPPASNVV